METQQVSVWKVMQHAIQNNELISQQNNPYLGKIPKILYYTKNRDHYVFSLDIIYFVTYTPSSPEVQNQ
jgi:hypothetical protein